ncbi:MAG: hypothetical protein AB3A66_09490 [Nodularia sp. CChRGM 3473]
MEHWQFLIQKQGDRSWHNLESPNLEISEGRYRVLARSHLRNTDVEIRVTHSSVQEIPPKRRIQKRSRRTNSEGLMAVIPFTHLKPGIWELQCSGDLMSDLFGNSWQYSIHIQVLPQEINGSWSRLGTGESVVLPEHPNTIADGNLISPVAVETTPTVQNNPATGDLPTQTVVEETVIDQPVSPVWLKGETAEQILQNLIEVALPASETLLENDKVAESSAIQPEPLLLLTLDQETYIARWGQVLTINGRVELQNNINLAGKTPYPESLHDLELLIELRSPLGSKIFTQVRKPLPDSSLPLSISSAINILLDWESKLILADISLYGAFTHFGEVILLASKSFTITADVTELLAVTAAAKSSQPNLLDHPSSPPNPAADSPEPAKTISIDLGLFNLAKTAQRDHSQLVHTSLNKSLTLSINSRDIEETALRVSKLNKSADSRWPQLPKLPENQNTAIATADVVTKSTPEQAPPVEKDETVAAIAPINLAQLLIRHHRVPMLGSIFPYLKRLKALPEETMALENQASEFPDVEDSRQMDTTVADDENTLELLTGDSQSQDDLEAEATVPSSLELINAANVQEESVPPSLELNTESHLYSSPLIRKWMQSQGYSLPESIIDVLEQQNIPDQQPPLSTPTVDVDSSLNLEVATEMAADAIPSVGDTMPMVSAAMATAVEETEILGDAQTENLLTETPSTWLAQEIVVDDTYTDVSVDFQESGLCEQENQAISDSGNSSPIDRGIVEPLPIPQLHVPEGELIAGTSVRVRAELPAGYPQVIVKLWVEDCHTRWLLDGPHLLTDLLPNPLGNLEVMTQLNIPFGCLEIRLEAIAFHQVTQQESHKVTVVRTVIPPDLPNLRLDELLGM